MNYAKILAQAGKAVSFLFTNGFIDGDEHTKLCRRISHYQERYKVDKMLINKEMGEL